MIWWLTLTIYVWQEISKYGRLFCCNKYNIWLLKPPQQAHYPIRHFNISAIKGIFSWNLFLIMEWNRQMDSQQIWQSALSDQITLAAELKQDFTCNFFLVIRLKVISCKNVKSTKKEKILLKSIAQITSIKLIYFCIKCRNV